MTSTPQTAVDPGAISRWAAALRASALVGTSRRAAGSLPAGLAPADHASPLDQAALLDVLGRAGATPTAGEPVAPAPANRLPEAPAAAVQLLTLLLRLSPLTAGARDAQLDRWLERCAAAGYGLPADLLPEVVAMARQRRATRAAFARVWDERGRWYAEMFAPYLLLDAPAEDDEATPPDGRAAVGAAATSWEHATAKERVRLLEAMMAGLSIADEPFLEAALDDRAKTVRALAARLLTQLPESRLAQRMGRRLTPLIRVTRRLLRDPLVAVDPPTSIDDAAVRDGLDKDGGNGKPVAWLRAIIAAAPLSAWTDATGLPPEKIVKQLAGDQTVTTALLSAVALRRDTVWAAALTASSGRGDLVHLLPPEQQTRWMIDALRSAPANPLPFLRAAREAPQPWPTALATAVADRIARSADGDPFLLGFDERLQSGFGPEVAAHLDRLTPPEDHARARRILAIVRQNTAFARSIDDAFPPRRNP
jgi:hypothetical protein